jgi:putative pyruvate formate lyase activating enzyme
MDQYRPCYRASDYPELDRPITMAEYQAVLEFARYAGLARLDHRAKVRRFVPQL